MWSRLRICTFRVRLKEAEEWLKKFIAEHVTKVTVHKYPQVLPGDPADEILEFLSMNMA